jgi:hypothetical protein
MKTIDILNNVKLLWPNTISLNGSKIINEGFLSPELSFYWEKAQMKISDDWEDLGVWVFYTLLHKIALSSFKNGIMKVEIKDIDIFSFQSYYYTSLKDYDIDMFKNYESINEI